MYTSSASDKQIWNRYWVIKGLNEVMDVWVSLCRGINCSSSTPFSRCLERNVEIKGRFPPTKALFSLMVYRVQ